jgi:hypothetical protein
LDRVSNGEFSWGALFWVPLMLGAEDEQVVELWLTLVAQKVPPGSQPDVLYVASLFAELANRLVGWNRVVEGDHMTESVIANRMIELGEMRMAREALLRVVRFRFPALLTLDVQRAIADQPSLTLMQTWLDAAFDPATTAESFLAVLHR